jgi:tRNA1Val (adenine37-N6)-methyltransferase
LAKNSIFKFRDFEIQQTNAVFKIGTDAMLLGAFIHSSAPKNILDIGSGTGVLSLFCAHKFKNASLISLDIHPEAVALCNINFKSNNIEDRAKAILQEVTTYDSLEKFDLIISNPPYFESSTKNALKHLQIARHQDSLTLASLVFSISRLISEHGTSFLILPFQFEEKIIQLLAKNNLNLIEQISIHSLPEQPWRIIFVLSKYRSTKIEETITIRNYDGSYHESYKKKCGEFHDRAI